MDYNDTINLRGGRGSRQPLILIAEQIFPFAFVTAEPG